MTQSRLRLVLARALVAAGLAGAGLGAGPAPASAQWFGGLGAGPIPPGSIVRSLMSRGFVEIGRPRFDGEVYVVEGIDARGLRLRLAIDAYDGSLVSRTRLDAPLLPPADVGRRRDVRADPFRNELGPGLDDLPPRGPGRARIDRGELPPPGARRADRIDPPLAEPDRTGPPIAGNLAAKPVEPRRGERVPPPQRQAKRPEPSARQSLPPSATANPVEPRTVPPAATPPATAAAPSRPVKAPEPQPPASAAPAVEAPAPGGPVEAAPAREAPAQRTVRVIEGVTPVAPQAGEARKPEEKKPEITPPAALE